MQVFATKIYERAIRKLISEDSRQEMEVAIVACHTAAPAMPGTGVSVNSVGPVRVRGSEAAFGQDTFIHAGPEVIYMLTAYAKAVCDDLSPSDKRALTRRVAAIKGVEKTP